MELFGIGPLELALIVALALILMGPKDMAKAGRTIGKWLNDFVKSETWQVLRDTSKTVRNLPAQLMREANFEEAQKERPANPSLPKYGEMDAIAKAPKQNLAPPPSNPEEDALERTILAPARSQPVVEPVQPLPAPEPVHTEATLLEMDLQTSGEKTIKVRKSREPVESASAGKTDKKSKSAKAGADVAKRGKKPNA
ncbi:MAG: twin-arginine translocase TatA/TatE family subunit [Chloroflexota bacterium]